MGRIGGEEFAIFLSNTKSSEALEIAERIRKSIQDTNFRYEGKDIPLSVSAGTSTLGCDTSFEELYKQADEALYDSKSNGRNRVSSFSET